MVAEAADAVNWTEYFLSIRSVCPWSNVAWNKGKIDIVKWNGKIIPLDDFEARLYLAPKHKPRQLKKMCDRFNWQRTHEEWLWSHPLFEVDSTPIPVFIQQDRTRLESIRNNLKQRIL